MRCWRIWVAEEYGFVWVWKIARYRYVSALFFRSFGGGDPWLSLPWHRWEVRRTRFSPSKRGICVIWHFIIPGTSSIWFSLLRWNAHQSYMVRISSLGIKVSGASISQLQPCRVSIFVQGLVCLLQQRCAEGWPGGEKRGNIALANHSKMVIQSSRAENCVRSFLNIFFI